MTQRIKRSLTEVVELKLKKDGVSQMEEKKKNIRELERMIGEFHVRKELKKIDPNIPINQQMSLNEYIEQVFLCLMLNHKHSIQVVKDSMKIHWSDFPEYYNDNWDPSLVGTGIAFNYL